MTDLRVTDKPEAPARRRGGFPSADLVDAAAGMFTTWKPAERPLAVGLDGVTRGHGPAAAKTAELFGDPLAGRRLDRELVEGPRFRIEVSPGAVAVRSTDPARAERAWERRVQAALSKFRIGGDDEERPAGGATVTSWSPKSRARMVETIAQLDLAPLLARGGRSVMLTLTYPGDWRPVAADPVVCRRHVDALRARWRRRFGLRLDGVWKREFQRRGAPHYHIWTVLPADVTVTDVRRWLGPAWAGIVGHPDLEERQLHEVAGTAVDASTGDRSTDPRRLGVYFSKHGSFAAKEYQNHAPSEWVETGSVGRFWGVWGLRKAVRAVEVHGDDALAARRILRRHSRANGYVARVPTWKYRTIVDQDTGEVRAHWWRSTRRQRVYRRLAGGGFVVTNDGPALAAALARSLDAGRTREGPPRRSGTGPVGWLP